MTQDTEPKAVPPRLVVEVAGCPNACRHCFLEATPRGSERGANWVRSLHTLFSEYARGHGETPPEISLHMQEPFYHSRWHEMPLRPESEYVRKILGEPEAPPEWNPSGIGLTVHLDGSAYPDHCSMEDDWHCLGNVFEAGPEPIVQRLHAGEPPGLRVRMQLSQRELAKRYGDAAGRKVYGWRGQLVERWIRQWCENGAT